MSVESHKQRADRHLVDLLEARRSNAALRGVITKLKRRVAGLEIALGAHTTAWERAKEIALAEEICTEIWVFPDGTARAASDSLGDLCGDTPVDAIHALYQWWKEDRDEH